VLLVETGREAEIGQLDVTETVNENVIGFDVAEMVSYLVVQRAIQSRQLTNRWMKPKLWTASMAKIHSAI
jgi:hypothetical protein